MNSIIKAGAALCSLALMSVAVSAKERPLDGKDYINHDYNCIGLSSGQKAELNVSESPGGASILLTSQVTEKTMPLVMTSIDDQTRVSRQYKFKFPNGAEEVLEVADLTKMASITMLHTSGLEIFTSLVCHEDG